LKQVGGLVRKGRAGPRIEPFEEHTARYDEWFESHREAYRSELLALKDLAPQTRKSIEIGVGSGRFAAPLSVRFGVEPSPRMAKLSQSRGIDVLLGAAEALPFQNAAFDLALMVTTVCFVDDIATAFGEAFRVLRPNGTLVVGFIDRGSPLGRSYQKMREVNPFYGIASFRSVREVLGHLQDAGFREFEIRQTVSREPGAMSSVEEPKEGHGVGSFVAVKGLRPASGNQG
jgi:SAM-dependent methyltransferase